MTRQDKGKPEKESLAIKSGVRSRIEARMQQAEEERKREVLKRRLEFARGGAKYFEQKQYVEAIRFYHSYLHVLEEWKGVTQGSLTPAQFDLKKEMPELVLISGVYWDLVKLYDQTRSKAKFNDFKHYLDKYVLFSKGFPYQPMATEAIRKYLANGKAFHRNEFKAAYQTLGGQKCFIATSLVDVCNQDTLPKLRSFRDTKLLTNVPGRAFVKVYYQVGPTLADILNRSPQILRKSIAKGLDLFAQKIHKN